MREILFRGKTLLGKWIEGDLLNYLGCGKVHIAQNYKGAGGQEVDPSTVGQYTGLIDKRGKKIFEGDIIKWGFKPCVVKWDEYNASFCLYVYGTIKVAGFNQETMNLKKVAGNMYDSPELLEGVTQ